MKTLGIIIAIIAVIILILLLAPRRTAVGGYYGGYRNYYSASVTPLEVSRGNAVYIAPFSTSGTRYSYPGYTIERYIPQRKTTTSSYGTSYHYVQQPVQYYPDGCDATTLYSATTGLPCQGGY